MALAAGFLSRCMDYLSTHTPGPQRVLTGQSYC